MFEFPQFENIKLSIDSSENNNVHIQPLSSIVIWHKLFLMHLMSWGEYMIISLLMCSICLFAHVLFSR